MKSLPPERRELLDNLLTEAESSAAPSFDLIAGHLNREKRARMHRRMAGTTAIIAMFAALLLAPRSKVEIVRNESAAVQRVIIPIPEPPDAPVVPAAPKRAEWTVERVSDEQLLELFADTAVALARYPDGNRRLMMVVNSRGLQ